MARALRFPNSRRHFLTNRRFHRHISFETVLGLAAHYEPPSYWDIVKSNETILASVLNRSGVRRAAA